MRDYRVHGECPYCRCAISEVGPMNPYAEFFGLVLLCERVSQELGVLHRGKRRVAA